MAKRKKKPADDDEVERADDEAERADDDGDDDVLIAEVVETTPADEAEPAHGEISTTAASSGSSLAAYDPLAAYMREIQRFSLLTREQEARLAQLYLETQDVGAARQLVTANLRLVVKISFEYRRAYRNLLDLIQEGNIGLMQAVRKYDPYRGVKFSSYAALWIRAYILRFVLNNWRLVKLGTTQVQRKLFYNLNKEKARLSALGIEPTSAEVAKQLDVPEREVIDMEGRLSGREVSLDAPGGGTENARTPRVEMLPSRGTNIDDLLAAHEEGAMYREKIHAFGSKLAGKDAVIFEQRLIADEPRTLQDIGDEFGVSRERVRQLEKRLQDRLRKYLEAELGPHR